MFRWIEGKEDTRYRKTIALTHLPGEFCEGRGCGRGLVCRARGSRGTEMGRLENEAVVPSGVGA
jgi:hypothetical protein